MEQLSKTTADFLQDADALKVMQALNATKPDCARFVGGCVRDAIMGREVKDIDIATKLVPQETIKALKSAKIKYAPTGIEHGTISAIISERVIEITTLRQDVETDGRHANIAFTDDWLQDATRRDFTCNSLYCDIYGNLFEPIAGALSDCKNGIIRFVGNADARVKEDYLRIMRFFRFYAWFGKGEMDEGALLACAKHKNDIKNLSRERIWAEFEKLLNAPNPFFALSKMQEIGVLEIILGFAPELNSLNNLIGFDDVLQTKPEAFLRFMALFIDKEIDENKIAHVFRLSNGQKSRLKSYAKIRDEIGVNENEISLKAKIYIHSKNVVKDASILAAAKINDIKLLQQYIKIIDEFAVPVFPIDGENLKALNIPTGPKFGKILKAVEAKWIESDFKLSREELLAQLENIKTQYL